MNTKGKLIRSNAKRSFKRFFVVMMSCLLIITGLVGCNADDKTNKQENTSGSQEEAWALLVNSLEKLKSQNKVAIYNCIGTFDTVHEEYHSIEKDGKKIMEYLKGGYNIFLQKTIIDNTNNETIYLTDYGSIGECTSVGNKYIYREYVETDESIFPEKIEKEYDLTYQNLFNVLNPMYEKIKKEEPKSYEKYIVKGGKATAYVDGKKRYENKDITSIESVTSTRDFPPLYNAYANGPLKNISDDIKENDDFSYNWVSVLKSVGRTLWGFEIPSRNICDVKIDKKEDKTLINYKLNKDLSTYKTYKNEINESSKSQDLSWNSVSYFDDAYINAEIDKEGNLRRLEFNSTMAYINEGIEGFKVPQYAIIEFEY